jgi:N-acetylglucosamine kinase-like BadF-type ATPase
VTRQILLGVDGGNTKTLAVAATADGEILGTGRVVRRSDIHAVPVDAAISVYGEATDAALGGAEAMLAGRIDPGGTGDRRVVAAFSLAGADWPEDVALLTERLSVRWPGVVVVNDAIGALRAAIPTGAGVVVVCGTGTATGARGPDGRTWYSGFWQEVQGGHELGVRALQAIYRAELGIDPPTALTTAVLAATGEPDVEALLHHASGRDVVDRRDPKVLAPVLLDVADRGDPAAVAIVDRHGTALGRTAVAAARRVGIGRDDPFDLALAGGVLRGDRGRLREAILAAVAAEAPAVRAVEPALEPVAGALLLAFDSTGIPTGPDILSRIGAGLASSDLFETRRGASSG